MKMFIESRIWSRVYGIFLLTGFFLGGCNLSPCIFEDIGSIKKGLRSVPFFPGNFCLFNQSHKNNSHEDQVFWYEYWEIFDIPNMDSNGKYRRHTFAMIIITVIWNRQIKLSLYISFHVKHQDTSTSFKYIGAGRYLTSMRILFRNNVFRNQSVNGQFVIWKKMH